MGEGFSSLQKKKHEGDLNLFFYPKHQQDTNINRPFIGARFTQYLWLHRCSVSLYNSSKGQRLIVYISDLRQNKITFTFTQHYLRLCYSPRDIIQIT